MKTNKINQTEEQPKEDTNLEKTVKNNMSIGIENQKNILKIMEYINISPTKQPTTQKQSSKELEAKEKFKMIDRVFIPKKKQWHILKQNDFEDFETEVVNSK